MWNSFLCIISQGSPKDPQNNKTPAILFGYPLELDKTQLRRLPYNLDEMHREIKLELSSKHLSCQIPFIVLEGAMQAPGGKQHQLSYPAMNPTRNQTNLPGRMCPLIQ